jgi:hypothetical protein
MKKLLLILLCYPLIGSSQVNYTVTVNTPDAWQANLFFQVGGSPQKPVKIIDPSITEIYSQNLGMKGWDFKVNYNNKLSYFDRQSKGWFIMDSLQNVVDSVYCQNGYIADNHDFLALANGNYVLFAYDEQPYAMDTVVAGGDPNAIVEGLIIQELDASHNVIFEWKSWDHFHVTDNTYMSPWTGANLNFIHANAIDIDFDGHFLVSCRGLDEITKIHRTTGEVIWRWGGSQTDITFANDYPFTHQHSIRSLGDNRYILYDNGNYSAQYTGTANISRAVEYELDTNLMEATRVWEFVHPDSLYTPSIGGVQRLPNGNTLIDFGNLQWLNLGSIVTEVDTNNQIVFQLEYANGGNLYRAQKFDWFFYTPILGCTDSLASNYNPLATIDDSSCIYCNHTVIVSTTNVSCNGYNDGSIILTASGGVPPFQYSLGGALSQTNGTFSVLTAGIYSVDVTDANGCMIFQTVVINEPNPLFVNAFSTDISCFGYCDGSAFSMPSGGTPPYSYLWSNGNITDNISVLCAGAYIVNVTDSNNCVNIETLVILEPSALSISVDSTDETSALNDGSVTAFLNGGVPAYAYAWSNGGAVNPQVNLAPGLYTVDVTDANGCIISDATFVNAYNPTGVINIKNTDKTVIKVTDVLGQETPYRRNIPLFYIYDDGKVEQRIIVE